LVLLIVVFDLEVESGRIVPYLNLLQTHFFKIIICIIKYWKQYWDR
jgi:hypothetical protein